MRNIAVKQTSPVIEITLSALKAVGFAIAGLVILTTILSLPSGGPLILLYYWAYVVFYILPIALLVGAFLGLVLQFPIQAPLKKKIRLRKQWNTVSILGTLLVFVLIFGYIAFPYFTIGQDGLVEHGATWFYIDANHTDTALTARERESCDIQTVLFRLDNYDIYEVVCDQSVLDYLAATDAESVKMTYRVTYDFGDPRSYQLIAVGPVSVTWNTWAGGWRGCGRGRYDHSCASEQAQAGSHLLESTWIGE